MTTKTQGSSLAAGVFSIGSSNYSKSSSIAPLSTVDSVTTPGYFTKRRKGATLPVNPFHSVQREVQALPGSFEHGWSFRGRPYEIMTSTSNSDIALNRLHQRMASGSAGLPPISDYEYLLTEAEAKANSGAWDIGTMAAEFGKTVELVGRARERTYKRAHDIVKNIRRRDRTMENFSEAWLEYRYGWRPLMYDIQAAEEAYHSINRSFEKLYRASASFKDADSSSSDSTSVGWLWVYNGSLSTGWGPKVTTAIKTESRLEARAGVGHKRSIQNQTAFIDPVTTAWELVPFSFVADWFINVGDNLTAFSPFFSDQRQFAYITLYRETTETVNVTFDPLDNRGDYRYKLFSSRSSHATLVSKETLRVPRSDIPAGLTFRSKFDASKALDLIALGLLRKTQLLGLLRKTSI